MVGRWLLSESQDKKTKRVIIYGAGSAGRQLAIALTQSVEYKTVAFIDDNSELQRQFINDINIVSRDDLKSLIKKKNVTEVLPSVMRLSIIWSLISYLCAPCQAFQSWHRAS